MRSGNEPERDGALALIILVLLAFLAVVLVFFSSGWLQVDVGPRLLSQ